MAMSRRRSAMASKPQYSTLPDHDIEGAGLQPLELESEHQNDHRSKRQSFTYTATCLFALLLVMVGYGAHKGGDITEVPDKSKGGGGAQTEDGVLQDFAAEDLADPAPRYIFCYGDSLTFGMTGMHTTEGGKYPYAEYLQEELNYLYDPAFDNTLASEYTNSSYPEKLVPPTLVEHLGLPGWTAEMMLNHKHDQKNGLCSIIQSLPKLSLLIILVGTNDVLQMTESSKDVGRKIISQIIGVHQGAFECAEDEGDEGPKNLHTLALGIPGSAFQEKVPIVKEMTSFINGALKNFASSYEGGKVSFLDFPLPYLDGDKKWSGDGIHLTKEGYAAMGKELAPRVKDILDGIDSE